MLWDVFNGCKNYNVLSGHKNAVLQVQWRQENTIVSCSADKTVAIWDANRGIRIRKFSEHTGIVNSVSVARDNVNMFASGSDDCTANLWDQRSKTSLATLYHDYQVCAVAMAHDGYTLFTAGIDNIVRRFDTRVLDINDSPDMILEGHRDTITGLAVSPDGTRLLSNAMDGTLRSWNIRPFVASESERCEQVFHGVHHGAEKLLLKCSWSPDQEYVSAGSADRLVHLWDATNANEICAWQGHSASINEVIFHPSHQIIASCSSDKTIMLGEYSI